MNSILDSIRARVDELVVLAPWWASCAEPLEAARIEAFEAEHGVTLPEDHRAVLLDIGDHAPLPSRPDGALARLTQARGLTTASSFVGPLADPFAFTTRARDGRPSLDAIEVPWDDDADDYVDPRWLRGCLPLTGAGCDESFVLVVSGLERGRVWSITPSAGPELHPTGLEFGAWYLGELDRSLSRERARVAERENWAARVAADPHDFDAAVALGQALVHEDRRAAAALLEPVFAAAPDHPGLARALAPLDLLDPPDPLDPRIEAGARIDALADRDPPWGRVYAGIAAARRGDDARAIELLANHPRPAGLGALAAGHLALALARRGSSEAALAILRAGPASRDNLELAAKLHETRGELEAAASIRARLRAPVEARPRAPSLDDALHVADRWPG